MAMGTKQQRIFSGWTNVCILFLCYFIIYGVVFYGFNVIFPAMIKALKWSRGDASVAHTIRALLVGLLAPAVAYIINRWGSGKALVSGTILSIIGLVLLGTVTTKIWQWILIWGVLMGMALSLAGQIAIQTNVTFWFTKNRGLALGIVMTGACLGGFLAQPVFTWIMKLAGTWQVAWLAAAGMCFFSLAAIWLKNKPADYGQYPDNLSPEEIQQGASTGRRKVARTYRTRQSWTLREAMRTRTMWFLMICYCMTAMPIYIVTTHGVLHITDQKYTVMQAAYILSFVVLFAGVGRFPMGWLADYVEPRWLISISLTGILITLYLFWQAPSLTTLVICSCTFGLCYGSLLVLIPNIVGNYYGPPAFASINGFMFPIQIGTASLVPVIAGYIHDVYRSYDAAFIALLVLAVVAVIAALLSAAPIKESEQTPTREAARKLSGSKA